MESQIMEGGGSAMHRLDLLDELDRLEKENLDRRPVAIVLGAFTFSFVRGMAGGALVWGGAALASFALFLALMVPPIKRFQRIQLLRRQLKLLESSPSDTALPPRGAAL